MRPLLQATHESVPYPLQFGQTCPSSYEQVAGQALPRGVHDPYYNNVLRDVSPWPQLQYVHSGVENAAVDNLTLLIQ